jgi:two-component system, sensor histidine kinase
MDGRHPSRRRDDLAAALLREMQPAAASLAALTDLLQRRGRAGDADVCVRALAAETDRMLARLASAAELVQGAAPTPELEDVVLRKLTDRFGDTEGVVTAYDGAPDLCVRADARRLHRVLSALVEHVGGARRDGPVELSVAARSRGGSAEIHIRIRGPARDEVEGLNMLAARRALDAWSAELRLNPTPGEGLAAEFRLEAPLAKPAETARPDRAIAAASPLHLLIVDDNATNRLVAGAFCEMFGCTFETAEDGVEAVEAAATRPFDLILMDIKMPRMDGVAATRAIRALPGAEAGTPIIALTANADPDDVRSYRAAGMVDVIEKPIKADRLAAVLSAAASGALTSADCAA